MQLDGFGLENEIYWLLIQNNDIVLMFKELKLMWNSSMKEMEKTLYKSYKNSIKVW